MFDKKTITDFGNQFYTDSKIDGYFGNISLLRDVVRPFVLKKIKNKTVMEIGSGSGRILKNLITYKPKKIFAIEPSKAIYIAKRNNPNQKCITFVKKPAQKIKYINFFDYVFSLGVIHHISQDLLVVRNIYRSLKKNGKFVFWVYGYEENEIYLLFINYLRRKTVLLPDFILRLICFFFNILSYLYIFLCFCIYLAS
jgi:SAM-dependent methyltransferase